MLIIKQLILYINKKVQLIWILFLDFVIIIIIISLISR